MYNNLSKIRPWAMNLSRANVCTDTVKAQDKHAVEVGVVYQASHLSVTFRRVRDGLAW